MDGVKLKHHLRYWPCRLTSYQELRWLVAVIRNKTARESGDIVTRAKLFMSKDSGHTHSNARNSHEPVCPAAVDAAHNLTLFIPGRPECKFTSANVCFVCIERASIFQFQLPLSSNRRHALDMAELQLQCHKVVGSRRALHDESDQRGTSLLDLMLDATDTEEATAPTSEVPRLSSERAHRQRPDFSYSRYDSVIID